MKEDKLVSVLIPAYNRANHIEQTIQSVLNQTYSNIEIVIYNDGSTDNTKELLLKYKDNNKFKIIHNNKNNGVGYARNILMSSANGEYLCWLDSDDLSTPERIEKLYHKLENSNHDIIYSKIQWFSVGKSGKELGEYINAKVSLYDKDDWWSLHSNTICATGFFKNNLAKFKFIEDLELGGEDVLWLWALLQKDIKIGYLNKPLYLYRSHTDRIGILKRRSNMVEIKQQENIKMSRYIEKIKS